MAAAIARSAKLLEVLVYYDEPQLVLLKTDRDYDMLAVAVQREGMSRPFFACEPRERALERYFDGKADLHYAFREARGHRYYFFDLDEEADGAVALQRATDSEVANEQYWPKVGFFARSHTNPVKTRKILEVTVREFRIDGNWGAADFSRFHGKMSDLYALFSALKRLDGREADEERRKIKRSVQDRFWQGGGSYVGFYDDLVDEVRSISPLEVAGIQYASPGYIALRGDDGALADISRVVETLSEHAPELHERYLSIYGVLRKEKLLRAPKTAEFSSEGLEQFVFKQSLAFAADLQLDKAKELLAACDGVPLIFAKIVLSIFRRANELYMFQAEGRVQSG